MVSGEAREVLDKIYISLSYFCKEFTFYCIYGLFLLKQVICKYELIILRFQ